MFFKSNLNQLVSVINRDEILRCCPGSDHKTIETEVARWLHYCQNAIQPDDSYKLALVNYRVKLLAGKHYTGELERKITEIFSGSVEGFDRIFDRINECSELIFAIADAWDGEVYPKTAKFLRENADTIIAFRDCEELSLLLNTLKLPISRIDDVEATYWLEDIFCDENDMWFFEAFTKANLKKITPEIVSGFEDFFPKVDKSHDLNMMRRFIRLFLIAEKPEELIREIYSLKPECTQYLYLFIEGLNLEGTFEDRKFFIDIIKDEVLGKYIVSYDSENYQRVCLKLEEAEGCGEVRTIAYDIWFSLYMSEKKMTFTSWDIEQDHQVDLKFFLSHLTLRAAGQRAVRIYLIADELRQPYQLSLFDIIVNTLGFLGKEELHVSYENIVEKLKLEERIYFISDFQNHLINTEDEELYSHLLRLIDLKPDAWRKVFRLYHLITREDPKIFPEVVDEILGLCSSSERAMSIDDILDIFVAEFPIQYTEDLLKTLRLLPDHMRRGFLCYYQGRRNEKVGPYHHTPPMAINYTHPINYLMEYVEEYEALNQLEPFRTHLKGIINKGIISEELLTILLQTNLWKTDDREMVNTAIDCYMGLLTDEKALLDLASDEKQFPKLIDCLSIYVHTPKETRHDEFAAHLASVTRKSTLLGPLRQLLSYIPKEEITPTLDAYLDHMGKPNLQKICHLLFILPLEERLVFMRNLSSKEPELNVLKHLRLTGLDEARKNAAFQHFRRLLNSEYIYVVLYFLKAIARANHRDLYPTDLHSLIQQVESLMRNPSNPLNPYRLQLYLNNARKRDYRDYIPDGREVNLNPEGFRVQAAKRKMTYGDLPSDVAPADLTELFQSIQERNTSEREAAIKELAGEISGFAENPYLISLLEATGGPEEAVATDVHVFQKQIATIKALSNEIPEGSLFSPQEELFLQTAASIKFCPAGMREAILNLGAQYMDVIAPNHVEDAVRDIVSNLLLNQFNGESAFMRWFTGHPNGIPQIPHHAQYAKNLIGHIIGLDSPLTFDHHTECLTPKVLDHSVKEVLDMFYLNFSPEKMVKGVQREINRSLELMSDEQAGKLAQGLWEACGGDYFEWDEDVLRPLKFSESGCKTLLVNMGYLFSTKSREKRKGDESEGPSTKKPRS